MKPTGRFFTLSNISLKQRLPLLIFSLLLTIIVFFSWISYLGVKNASLVIGKQRLYTLTDQLSGMFAQSFSSLSAATHTTASSSAIKNYLLSHGTASRTEALKQLDSLRIDTLSSSVELFDSQKINVLSSVKKNFAVKANMDSVLPAAAATAGYTNVGKMLLVDSLMYYPIVATVADENRVLGYLVRWRLLKSTPKAIVQLGQLIGANGTLYFGNDDGKFWTDMIKPVSMPPLNIHKIHTVTEYYRKVGDPLLASGQMVPNSRWLILVEFSQTTILDTARLFLRWIIVIGFAFAAAGSFVTWLMSRNITRPLKKLTIAATEIAGGNYASHVTAKGNDELGTLAKAFNSMAVQVQAAQQDLEKKVQARTIELEKANKEMEAFSYSVSHDLHAPLRIIKNYGYLLSEKAADKLDAEGSRILGQMMSKAELMGVLIDELLKLSHLDRAALTMEAADMDAIVRLEVREQLSLRTTPVDIKINELLPVKCDVTLIRQVWSNLISNAIKYTSKKERPCIEISSFRQGENIVYSIKDNGVGFDMKYADKLFGVFQRMHGKKEFEGNGVGLAVIQRVILKHGGHVWAEAEENNGAAFYFSLPG